MAKRYEKERAEMVTTARLIWERRLTNAAGGNFAMQVEEDRMLISPSMMSEHKHCVLEPEDFMLVDFDLNILEGGGKLSRESLMHALILKNFKNIGATIHAHPFYCMPFVSQGKAIPNVTEATKGRGFVECIPWQKAYSDELSIAVYEYFVERRERAERKPLGAIMPLHGVCVTGPNIYMAYSMLERIECDAFCTLMRSHVPDTPMQGDKAYDRALLDT
jgi:L-fuculose-phosphate aldolase